jgi:hypothetical protein
MGWDETGSIGLTRDGDEQKEMRLRLKLGTGRMSCEVAALQQASM